MSDDPAKRPDEQIELLKEIRDILALQTREASARWDAQERASSKAKRGCFGSIILITAILILSWAVNLISK